LQSGDPPNATNLASDLEHRTRLTDATETFDLDVDNNQLIAASECTYRRFTQVK